MNAEAINVVIIDYGSGNLRSAAKAFERVLSDISPSAKVTVSSEAAALASASHIVLPGVGAYGDCRAGLDSVPGMTQALGREVIEGGKPFLGICVGMQLMAERGIEHGTHAGLGWIDGEVVPLSAASQLSRSAPDGASSPLVSKNLKIPHMGWNELTFCRDHPVTSSLKNGDHVYFVHGYHLACTNRDDILATTDYGGPVTAMVARDNMIGTQFHPEKSQAAGLALIDGFLRWRP